MGSGKKALVRTGHGRILVDVAGFGYTEIDLDELDDVDTIDGAIIVPEIDKVYVNEDDAMDFLEHYAELRKLNLLYDADGGIFGLYNPRHDSFRRITLTDEGVNLYEFIEPQFVIL